MTRSPYPVFHFVRDDEGSFQQIWAPRRQDVGIADVLRYSAVSHPASRTSRTPAKIPIRLFLSNTGNPGCEDTKSSMTFSICCNVKRTLLLSLVVDVPVWTVLQRSRLSRCHTSQWLLQNINYRGNNRRSVVRSGEQRNIPISLNRTAGRFFTVESVCGTRWASPCMRFLIELLPDVPPSPMESDITCTAR